MGREKGGPQGPHHDVSLHTTRPSPHARFGRARSPRAYPGPRVSDCERTCPSPGSRSRGTVGPRISAVDEIRMRPPPEGGRILRPRGGHTGFGARRGLPQPPSSPRSRAATNGPAEAMPRLVGPRTRGPRGPLRSDVEDRGDHCCTPTAAIVKSLGSPGLQVVIAHVRVRRDLRNQQDEQARTDCDPDQHRRQRSRSAGGRRDLLARPGRRQPEARARSRWRASRRQEAREKAAAWCPPKIGTLRRPRPAAGCIRHLADALRRAAA